MKNGKIKLILIAVLSILVLILFYFYVSSDDEFSSSSGDQTQGFKPVTKDKLQSDIDSILYTFGIKPEWIKEAKVKDKDLSKEQLLLSKEIKIPNDLLTVDLNFDITDHLRKGSLDTKVIEDPRSKNIDMMIISFPDSSEKTIGLLRFVYSDSVKRNAADVCIVLDSLEEYSLDDAENILNSTQEYSVFLPLRNDKADYQSMIIEMKKDFLLKFSVGNEDDIEADFKDNMKENLWRSKIRSAGISFPQVTGVILSSRNSDPEFYKAVEKEFINNKMTVYPDSVFSGFRTSDSLAGALFDAIVSENRNGKKYLFYDVNFDPAEFREYDRQVYALKKRGYRFFEFGDLMKRVSDN